MNLLSSGEVYSGIVQSNPSSHRLAAVEGQQLARDGYMVSSVLIICTPSAMFDRLHSQRKRGMLLSYRPCMVDESEANAVGKQDTRSESRKRAFDHHDTLDT